MSTLSDLKNVSAEDRKMIQEAEAMLGPEPSEMGFVKNLFWGRFREELVFPYPEQDPDDAARCEELLGRLDDYLENEHPTVEIDQTEEIPERVIRRLFELGVLGMTIPPEYGGLGLSVTSYNRVLERIGRTCASTAVVVSAHQSIGCKAIMLFGTEEQKRRWLPVVARESLSAFCLSEPNVGSDAAGQQTHCELSADGTHYVLNGEKKWSTSGATSALFTVMAKQQVADPKTGRTKEGVTALICTPDMPGVEVFQKNRSKCGIRGTWQARIRFTDVKVPRENLLHREGKGLNVALTCLNYGRCTLSAGVTGAAKQAMDQAVKWTQTRYQFGRPLSDFELVKERIARMSALVYAMDAMLYMTTGMLDRGDADIMVETAINKVFCSEAGWQVIDDAMQLMGGEGYMTENELERIWRDNRIHRIVEGSNEVMQSFIFAYGGKQLAEQMLGVKNAVSWEAGQGVGANLARIGRSLRNPLVRRRAVPLGLELLLRVKPSAPEITRLHPVLQPLARRLARLAAEHSHRFKLTSMQVREEIVTRQVTQARLADNAIYLHAMSCVLSKLDRQIRRGQSGPAFDRDRTAAEHFFELATLGFRENVRRLTRNADASMRSAAEAARAHNDTLPNRLFHIPEASPVAPGEGRTADQAHIRQFPGDAPLSSGGDGHARVDAPGVPHPPGGDER